jgi:hypothetical protein
VRMPGDVDLSPTSLEGECSATDELIKMLSVEIVWLDAADLIDGASTIVLIVAWRL